jgi:hypothetical protein
VIEAFLSVQNCSITIGKPAGGADRAQSPALVTQATDVMMWFAEVRRNRVTKVGGVPGMLDF